MKVSSRQTIGKLGEDLAAGWLEREGYSVLHRNWRNGRQEIDLIACKGNVLHFVEVKTRRSLEYGWPEEGVGGEKIARMVAAAKAYLFSEPCRYRVQIDVLAILLNPGCEPEYFLVEDVYL